MKCWKCGGEIDANSRFCPNCGAELPAAPPPPPQDQQVPPPPGGGWTGSGSTGSSETILKVFTAACAVLYGVAAVRGLIGFIKGVFTFAFGYFSFASLISLIFSLLVVGLDALMCLILVMFVLKRSPSNTGGLMILLGIGGVGIFAVHLVRLVFRLLDGGFYRFGTYAGQFFMTVLGAAVVVAGVYAILRFLFGEDPLAGKTQEELAQEVRDAVDGLGRTANEAAQGAKTSWDSAQQNRQQNGQQAQWQGQQQTQWQGQQTQWQGQNYGQAPVPPPNGYTVTRLKTDRSLLAYILLSLVTCGIYSWYFLYTIARDVNIACAGDGKQTAGLLKLILLSILTCGIYSWFWYYSLGNRLAENAPRYGLRFQENGTTILLWMLLGSMLCGVGFFIAWHILIKNVNTICGAYNHQHGI